MSVTLRISGMTCGGCVAAVKSTLLAQPGVVQAEVSLAGGRAEVSGTGLDAEALASAVTALGYPAQADGGVA